MVKIVYLMVSFSLMYLISTYCLANDKTIIHAKKIIEKCESSTWNKAKLLRLKEEGFSLKNIEQKRSLAKQLLHCLASPDPILRDNIAFTGLSKWLRENSFDAKFYQQMYQTLLNVIESKVEDEFAVYQSFSMLMLSEVARVDRKSPYLTDVQRDHLVNIGSE